MLKNFVIFLWNIQPKIHQTLQRHLFIYVFFSTFPVWTKKEVKKKRSRKTSEPACKKENTWKVEDISEFLREWMCWCVIVTTQEHVLYKPTGSKKPSCQIQFHSCWKLRLTSLTSPVTEWYSGLQYRQSSAKNI